MEDKATTEDNLREVWRVVYEICRQTNGRLATDRQTDTCTPTLIAILRITTGNETRYRPGRRGDMPHADGSTMVAKIAADLRPSADGSAARTSVVAGGRWLSCRQPVCL